MVKTAKAAFPTHYNPEASIAASEWKWRQLENDRSWRKAGVNLDDNDDDDDDIADDNEISKLDLEAIKKAAEAVLEDDLDDTLHVEPSPSSVVPRCGRKSVTSDLFHQWLASGSASNNTRVTSLPSPNNVVASSTTLQPNPTEIIDQTDKLIEYILDISNELDINVLVRTICM